MNKNCYRLVFSRIQGMLVPVAEITPNTGKARGESRSHQKTRKLRGVPSLLALSTICLSPSVLADIVADPTAPGNQQPTVLSAPNGTPVVNIQTPSSAGVSRNTYSQFDIDSNGVVLNNSHTAVQSQQGGWIQGNPWLATGEARIILNEVNSSAPSYLNGFTEVAGQKAQVVIANPSGITCDGCGFINSDKATLTTGKSIMNNGNLEGFQVEQGHIDITGKGMDASTTDYAEIIARSTKINAGVWAKQLEVTTGVNQVNRANGQITKNTATTPSAVEYSIDVSELGGMYANKIKLVGTEQGLGVRNAGEIGASAGEITLTADGRLQNSGRMIAKDNLQVETHGNVENSGTLYSQANTVINTSKDVSNTHIIAAKQNTVINAGGSVTGSSNSVYAAGLQDDLTLANEGQLSIQATHNVDAHGQLLSDGNQTIKASTVNLSGSTVHTNRDQSISASQGDINLQGSATTAKQDLSISTPAKLVTDQATLSASSLHIQAHDLINRQGQILQTGTDDLNIELPGDLDNTQGTIATNSQNLSVKAKTLTNTEGYLVHAGFGSFDINTSTFDGGKGITESNGQLNLSATTKAVLDEAQTTAGGITLNSPVISHQHGILTQLDENLPLSITAGISLDNRYGVIAGNQDASLSIGTLLNQWGDIHLEGDNASLNIQANGKLDNRSGLISSTQVTLNTHAGELDNTDGAITAAGDSSMSSLTIDSGTLTNAHGLLQSNGSVNINTHGQTLTNTASGEDAGILGGADVTLTTGELDNHSGYIGSLGNLTVQANGDIDNQQGGSLLSLAQLLLTGSHLYNQGGQLQSLQSATLDLTNAVDNTGGLLRSGETLQITADQLTNDQTQGTDQGIEGSSVVAFLKDLSDKTGQLYADTLLQLNITGSLDNQSGQITSAGQLSIQDSQTNKTLNITNTQGDISALGDLEIDGASLSGDGAVRSDGDLFLQLTGNYTHSQVLEANGNLSLLLGGSLVNNSIITSNECLAITAAGDVNNTQSGSLQAQTLALNAQSLTNQGLLNIGTSALLQLQTLNNLGTGRLYADHLAIEANTLNNLAESGAAPVIAARNRLDIGAGTITNAEHALLLSAGDMAIGGQLDANHQATGQASQLSNQSATIEALGNLTLNAAEVRNTNQHITTTDVTLPSESFTEYVLDPGDVQRAQDTTTHYQPDEVTVYDCEATCIKVKATNDTSDAHTRYDYTRTVTESQIQSTDPAKIIAGGSLSLTANSILNAQSTIQAGGDLNASAGQIQNVAFEGTRTLVDSGTATSYWRHRKSGRDSTSSSTIAYTPVATTQSILLAPSVYEANASLTGSNTLPAAYTPEALSSGVTATAVTVGERPPPLSVSPIVRLDIDQATDPLSILSGGVSLQVPDNSLYRQSPGITASYLVETDPAFADYRQWLSSDYLLDALSYDPASVQQRLGDGFYEQKLVREQVAQLTGRRYLDGFQSDEEQYRQLLENGATFAQQFQLTPGIALNNEQMAQLTSDMVWLVEQTVTLADGSTRKVLAPQLYVRVRDGDLSNNGTLLAADQRLDLNLSGDLSNSGTLAGRQVALITAENINNLGGRMQGNLLAATARNDLNVTGGSLEGGQYLAASAGRDLNVTSTTSTQQNAQGSRTHLDRVAGLYVNGSNGILNASAGRDLLLKAAQLNSGGSVTLTAGNDLRLDTEQTASSHQMDFGGGNSRAESHTNAVGTAINASGDIQLAAGQDASLTGSSLTSQTGSIGIDAGRDLTLQEGRNTTSTDVAANHTSHGTFSSRTLTQRAQTDTDTASGSSLSAGQDVSLRAGNNATLVGSDLQAGGNLSLTAGNALNLLAAENRQSSQYEAHTRKSALGINYANSQASLTRNQSNVSGSQAAAEGNLASASGGDTTLQASSLQAGGSLSLQAGGAVNIISATNTRSEAGSASSSAFGGALSSASTDSVQQQTVASSSLQAKQISIDAQSIVLEASQIEAQTIHLMADTVALVSGKNSLYENHTRDDSGILLREIETQGQIQQDAVAATLTAEQITLNGRELADATLSTAALLQQVSSEGQLTDAQLATLQAELQNQSWHEQQTTLSKMGSLIVQAVATYLAPGVGSTFGQSLGQVGQLMVQRAVNQLSQQVTQALLTAAITGNGIELDFDDLLKSAVKTGVLAGINVKLDQQLGLSVVEKGDYLGQMQQATLHTVTQTAIMGGDFAQNLQANLVDLAGADMANAIGNNQAALGTWGYNATHAALGCALAAAKHGDCSSGALGALAAENAAMLAGKNPTEYTNADILLLSQLAAIGSAALLNQQLEDAYAAGNNAVINNYLKHKEQQQFAEELNECKGQRDGDACVSRVRAEYKALSDKNNAALAAAFSECKASGGVGSACDAYRELAKDGLPDFVGSYVYPTDPNSLDHEAYAYLGGLDGVAALNQQDAAYNQAMFDYLIGRELSDELYQRPAHESEGFEDFTTPAGEYESAISAMNRQTYTDLGLAAIMMASPVDELTVGAYVTVKVGGTLVRASVRLVDGVKKLVTADNKVLTVAPAKRTSNQAVLGHNPDFIMVSDVLGARRFEVPMPIWNKMSEAEQWNANRKFLDRMIAKGNEVILATSGYEARAGSIYARELDYLRSKGYSLSSDGMSMLPPVR